MARGRKSSLRIVLSPQEHDTLQHWQRSTTIAAGRARRGRIILLLAAGHSQSDVAHLVGVQRPVVRKWRPSQSGGCVHARDEHNRKAGWFEVIVGKSLVDEGASKCFGFVHTYDTKPK